MNENIIEQPELETKENLENQEGSIFGKFKDAKSLLSAYNQLEAEFTRKSQKLAEIQKENKENAVFETSETLEEILKDETDMDKYKKEITEILTNNDKISNLPNKYRIAFNIIKEAENRSAKILDSQDFIDKCTSPDNKIYQTVISKYLSTLNNIPTSPNVISGNSTSIYFSPNNNKPKTIREAGEIFSKMLK